MNRPRIDALGCDMSLPKLNGIFSVFAFLLLKLIVSVMKVTRDDVTFDVWHELPKFFKASENADIVNGIFTIAVLSLVIFFFVKVKAGMSELSTPLKNLWTAVIASLSLVILCEFISILLSGGKESHIHAVSFFSLIFLLGYTVCQGLLGYRLFTSYNGRLSTLGGWMMASSVILLLLAFSAISYLMDSDNEGKYESVTEVILLGLFSAIPVILSFLPVYIAYKLLYHGIKEGATEPQTEAETMTETITQPIESTPTRQHDSRETMQHSPTAATETIKTNKSTMKWALIAIGGILAAVLVFFVVKATVNALIAPSANDAVTITDDSKVDGYYSSDDDTTPNTPEIFRDPSKANTSVRYSGDFYDENRAWPLTLILHYNEAGIPDYADYKNETAGTKLRLTADVYTQRLILTARDGNNDFIISLTKQGNVLTGESVWGTTVMKVRLYN